MEGTGNSSKPSPGREEEDVKPMMGTGDMISKQLEEMSLGPSEASGGDYHANSIAHLIADRRKALEDKKLIRRVEWKASNNEEEVEERANFESVMQLPDLAWEKVLEYITDSNERRMLRNMTKQWRELMLNERTTLLFSSVLPLLLFKTAFLKIKEAFNCRIVCKEWKRSFDQCLQEANNSRIEVKRDCSWEELTRHATGLLIVLEDEEELPFLGTFPSDQDPFMASRCFKFDLSQVQVNQNQQRHMNVFNLLQQQMGMEIDCLFLDLSNEHEPSLNVSLEHNPPNSKHLGIHEATAVMSDFLHIRLSPGLESLWLYNVHPFHSEKLLRDQRGTLKAIIQKGSGMDEDPIHGRDTFLLIQRYGPFPNLKTLRLEFDADDAPRFFDEFKNCAPSLEELRWKCTRSDYADVLESFRCVNLIGKNNLRHLSLAFMYQTPQRRLLTRRLIRSHEIIGGGCSLRLELPQLETLELTWQRMGVQNIDFIVPCESLKEFHLAVFRALEEDSSVMSNGNNAAEEEKDNESSDEIIAYNGYEERMYESNIWGILPDLRKLRISIITLNTDGWTSEEGTWSKFYTRDGLKKYQKEK